MIDKVTDADKTAANKKFQEVALAYAVLSNDRRRKRYDLTGSTAETLHDDEDFDWATFYREQFAELVTEENIKQLAGEYKGSDQERQDVLAAYEKYQGRLDKMYEVIMLSDILEDDDRFRAIVDAAIENEEVDSYAAWEREDDETREAAKEAERKRRETWERRHGSTKEAAEKAKAKQKGNGKAKKKTGGYEDLGGLAAALQKRQQDRTAKSNDFFANLEAKYAPKSKGKKRSTPMPDMPTEEEFAAAQAKLGSRSKCGRAKKKVVEDDSEGSQALDSEGDDSDEEDIGDSPPPKRKRCAKVPGSKAPVRKPRAVGKR